MGKSGLRLDHRSQGAPLPIESHVRLHLPRLAKSQVSAPPDKVNLAIVHLLLDAYYRPFSACHWSMLSRKFVPREQRRTPSVLNSGTRNDGPAWDHGLDHAENPEPGSERSPAKASATLANGNCSGGSGCLRADSVISAIRRLRLTSASQR